MGAFNIVKVYCQCPFCKKNSFFDIQFKFGRNWQINYHINDVLIWGGNENGKQSFRRVRVEGISGPCSHCGCSLIDSDIFIVDNIIVSAVLLPKDRDGDSENGYEVIE